MTKWKCSNCGYVFDHNDVKPPTLCPSCKEHCTFVDVTCYVPDCQGMGVDPRLGNPQK